VDCSDSKELMRARSCWCCAAWLCVDSDDRGEAAGEPGVAAAVIAANFARSCVLSFCCELMS
jgi:hypothetical protein